MSETIWAHAKDGVRLLDSDEPAPDGITADQDEPTTGNIALLMDGCVVYGQPAELLQLLSDGLSLVSAHLAGRN